MRGNPRRCLPGDKFHLWTTSANCSPTLDLDHSPGSAGSVVFVKLCSGLVPLTRRIAMFKPHRLLCATGNPDNVILDAARPPCPPSGFWSSTVSGRDLRDTSTFQVSPSTPPPSHILTEPRCSGPLHDQPWFWRFLRMPDDSTSSGIQQPCRLPSLGPRSRDTPSSTSQVREDLSRSLRGLSLTASYVIS